MNATLYLVFAGVFMAMGFSIGFTIGFLLGTKDKKESEE